MRGAPVVVGTPWAPAGSVRGMALSIGMVTVDSTDPRPLAHWWARQLGGRVVDESDGWFLEVVPAEG